MTSRQRVMEAINHRRPDRVPLDLGATGQTGINASTLYKLRRALGLEERRIYVHEPYQLLGWVERDLRDLLGVDLIGIWSPYNLLGIKNQDWKPWRMPDGTPVLMGGDFAYRVDGEGNTYAFPQGDRSAAPSLKLPREGYFFDSIPRRSLIDDPGDLNARRDYAELYSLIDEETARYFEAEARRLYQETEYGIVLNFGGGGLGDVAVIPGPYEKNPQGIRNIEDWFMAHLLYPEYVKELFALQSEVALKNLEILAQAVGERIQIIQLSATDFGGQRGEIFSPDQYREFYQPFHRRLNDWIHQHTGWKVQFHCCGSILRLLPDLIEAGVDLLNPVQCSARGMDPRRLKEEYGDRLVFWGAGVDTQKTLPFGTPDQVREEVRERLRIFSPGGGFIFSTVHNILGKTPLENILALLEAFHGFHGRTRAFP